MNSTKKKGSLKGDYNRATRRKLIKELNSEMKKQKIKETDTESAWLIPCGSITEQQYRSLIDHLSLQ